MDLSRLAPYLGIIAAALLGVFAVAFSNTISVQQIPPINTYTASSTLSVVPGFSVPLIIPPSTGWGAATTTTASSSKQEPPAPEKISAPTSPAAPKTAPAVDAVPVAAPTPAPPQPAPPTAAEQNAALDASASALRAALVNIICYVPLGSGLHSISGSGIFVDPKGIILTNAHIAQYFLLADRGADCTIRTGSPAADAYKATLIYIPPAWLHANATVLTQYEPSGTGEYDFAFLAVTKSANTKALPDLFPSITLATEPIPAGAPVVIATYGAQFLASSQVLSALFPTIVFGSVKSVFTFATSTIDVLALGGSAAAQEGSSGGGVADASGELVGTITTSTVTGATDTRSLSAITASYIRAEYASEMGSALDILLGQPILTSIAEFVPKMPALEAIITAQLP